jgi:hypothetical protein
MGKAKSKTVRDTTLVERLIGSHHYKTTISDGKSKVEGLGKDRAEAEKRASTRWEQLGMRK